MHMYAYMRKAWVTTLKLLDIAMSHATAAVACFPLQHTSASTKAELRIRGFLPHVTTLCVCV